MYIGDEWLRFAALCFTMFRANVAAIFLQILFPVVDPTLSQKAYRTA